MQPGRDGRVRCSAWLGGTVKQVREVNSLDVLNKLIATGKWSVLAVPVSYNNGVVSVRHVIGSADANAQ